MIAVDTNLLVYAHRATVPQHAAASAAMARLSVVQGGWAIPWPCAHEFVAVVTRAVPGVPATPAPVAFDALRAWLSHPGCRLLAESASHLDLWRELVERAGVVGGAVHDARIAAICLGHSVDELWSSDRDFARFPDLRTRDPLVPGLHEPGATPYRAARLDQAAVAVSTRRAAAPSRAPSKRSTPSSSSPRPSVRRSSR
ncbi:MAG: PIN domain-containing protein [Burkholderiaceae bacterium]|jgi:toxin-antitoxin system PIN domain toxin|nr:PIN domain-containing protein [Burkholderiales bacterium]MCZ8109134.1 PIN domain-containing protein [Burkholderiales bacterium]MCZ8339438.1 PIN domain-containing protein [Burkholderiaceae bacterium]